MSQSEVINSEELALLRAETGKWFTEVCDIYRESHVDDAYGGVDDTEAVIPGMTNIPCALESGAAHEQSRAVYGKIVGTQIFTITLPAETDVRVEDQIKIMSQNRKYRVQAVLDPESWEIERKVIASEEGANSA